MLKTATAALVTLSAFATQAAEDPYLWLEAIDSPEATEWVAKQNQASTDALKAYPNFQQLVDNSLAVLNDPGRIPYPITRGQKLYNFWQDDTHVRGIYRRTSVEEYSKAEPKWETVLDIDALGKAENESWVYKGMECLQPREELCMVSLSRGGGDAVVQREFNMTTKAFVTDQAFQLDEAKSNLVWLDDNRLLVATDAGKEGDLTESGYPRRVRLWERGTDLAAAPVIYEGEVESVGVFSQIYDSGKVLLPWLTEAKTFFTYEHKVFVEDQLLSLPLPGDAEPQGYYDSRIFLTLKSDLAQGEEVLPKGSLVSTKLAGLIDGNPSFQVLARPTATKFISSVDFSRQGVLVNWMDNVTSRLELYRPKGKNDWVQETIELGDNGSFNVVDASPRRTQALVQYTDFLTPPTLYQVNNQTLKFKALKSSPAHFDADKFTTEQYFARSKDGTQVPYFVVMAKDLKRDGNNPTLLYGYGGFEVPLRPRYSASLGRNWLEQGGVYVRANIRGGGEFGPAWHQAALKENRHKAFEDFEAIAEDLIARKITSSEHLGISGGSNGGLLVGAAFTRRPDLYNAVICAVPLLDMKRFDKLLAGASWVDEYGDPDVAKEWDYLKTYSPYHNVHADTQYPKVFFTTSTRDDRVHPAHARKMVARMMEQGHPVYYYENTEGGHAGAADNRQRAERDSLEYAYLLQQLSATKVAEKP